MTRYIVRPRRLLAGRAVSLASCKFDSASRTSQLKEVFDLRMSDPVDQEIRKWVADSKPTGVEHISRGERHTQVTGITVVDMPEQEAERMARELPEVLVIRDRPIELIKPDRQSAAAKKKLGAGDLWHQRAIGLRAARSKGFEGTGAGVTVAVLDTGIDPTHPELTGRVAGAYTFDTDNWDTEEMNPSRDTEGHGTHVAGLICGEKVGVAPGAQLLNGVMIPGGFGNLSDFVLALEWAATQPEVQIVNMSAGIRGYLPEMREPVADLLAVGVLPVIATGNEGRNRTRSPGNYNEVLSIGASNRQSQIASFSSGGTMIADNHQYSVPDLVAPGQSVYSSVMGGGYESWNGTSMATPITSGVAALILEKYPAMTVLDLQDTLLTTCRDLGFSADRQGEGLVQVKAAV
ncbi:MAG: S8 family serine peptidase [Kiloniellales bacterium]